MDAQSKEKYRRYWFQIGMIAMILGEMPDENARNAAIRTVLKTGFGPNGYRTQRLFMAMNEAWQLTGQNLEKVKEIVRLGKELANANKPQTGKAAP